MKHSPRTNSSTPAQRRALAAAVVVKAKAEGNNIPSGVKLIGFREPTAPERHFAKTLVPLTRKRSKAAA